MNQWKKNVKNREKIAEKELVKKTVKNGGDFLGDYGQLSGDHGNLLGDGGNLLGDGGDLLLVMVGSHCSDQMSQFQSKVTSLQLFM